MWVAGKMPREISDRYQLPDNVVVKIKRGWTFHLDNDPKHTAKVILSS